MSDIGTSAKNTAQNVGNAVIPTLQDAVKQMGLTMDQVGTSVHNAVSGGQSGGQSRKQVSQFGDSQLTTSQAYAACGPAAAVNFAQHYGRNPTLSEALNLAKTVGWTESTGMAGIGSEQQLLGKLGVPTKMLGSDWGSIANEAKTGNPVTISTYSPGTGGHYFYADNYSPDTGAFHVGQSGLDLKGGSEWMTPDQMQGRMGPIQGALIADNPIVPSASSASGGMAPPPSFQEALQQSGMGGDQGWSGLVGGGQGDDDQAQARISSGLGGGGLSPMPAGVSPWNALITQYAGDYADDPRFVRMVAAAAQAESSNNPQQYQLGYKADDPSTWSKFGGRGLWQFDIGPQGKGHGLSEDQLFDPNYQASVIVPEFASNYGRLQKQPGLSDAQLAAQVYGATEYPAGTYAGKWQSTSAPAYRNYMNAWNALAS
jgi:hypothetical protein